MPLNTTLLLEAREEAERGQEDEIYLISEHKIIIGNSTPRYILRSNIY